MAAGARQAAGATVLRHLARGWIPGYAAGRTARTAGAWAWATSSAPMALGNELGTDGDRTWLGTYRLAAVYCRALSGLEVARNFFAGADPGL